MSPEFENGRPRPRNGMGLTALVLGIFAAAFSFIPFVSEILAAPAAVGAVLTGSVGWLRADRGEATNGKDAVIGGVLGVFALFMALLVWTATNGA
ncbi:hypothetical protein IU433_00605 [Nocardia puris]|uniref:DUF4190 domain-containing protein n=1 Tax=Nocardia puris TaxID=208602 RepID=A0A366DUD6_9NOCA|nr:hypothetical protein [Nocardia puris]MBF6210284.1 hypothetical protein [Nocardia puris]MBF6367360.1 hypothetical protein [Nocardia puris]MBF6457545.1 hypothetical protein [Nocardia puris]RBO93703.1 hypothetical protein DFR74_102120 [Nocardia puris]